MMVNITEETTDSDGNASHHSAHRDEKGKMRNQLSTFISKICINNLDHMFLLKFLYCRKKKHL